MTPTSAASPPAHASGWSREPTQSPRSKSEAGVIRRARIGDAVLGWACRLSAALIALMLVSLIAVLVHSAWPAMREFGVGFLISSEWRANEIERPVRDAAGQLMLRDGEAVMEILPPAFGALPVIWGTAVSSFLALVIAVPISLSAAVFLVRVAPRLRIAGAASFLIEFLAAVPSLAFGVWALFVLAPLFQKYVGPWLHRIFEPIPGLRWMFYESVTVAGRTIERPIPLTGRDLFTGSLILAIMILPIVTSVSRDVLRAVPRTQIEGTLALGATWWQSCVAMLRYGRSGLLGAIMLGLARAAGETMAVTMVIGNNNQISPSPFAPAQTMASLLANEFAEATEGLHRASLLYVALILLTMSLMFNVVARRLVVGRIASSGSH
ncbi:MAG: phosphate ABC transporter permease subunit PstC [Phycisphaeraceae bacterium]|nr:phosphate ABC transporter permease subunit PstC [Phycisphaeraceae bacterium]